MLAYDDECQRDTSYRRMFCKNTKEILKEVFIEDFVLSMIGFEQRAIETSNFFRFGR